MLIPILLIIAGFLLRANASDIAVNGASTAGLILLIAGVVWLAFVILFWILAGAVVGNAGRRNRF